MTFSAKKIALTIQLAQNTQTNQPNTFDESRTDTITLTDRRMSVKIQNSGAPVDCRAQVKVYGLTPSQMNQLSTLGLVYNIVPRNKITIAAGDGPPYATVFSGTIQAAYGDYSAQPLVPFHFECNTALDNAVAPQAPSSFLGTTTVESIMSGLARQMGLTFENNGVNATLASPYFAGALRQQAQDCAEHAGIKWGIIDGKLAIWPNGSYRSTPNIPIISAETGMANSPAFTQQGIIVKTVFNPSISYGGLVQVKSSVLQGVVQAQQSQNAQFKLPKDSIWAVNNLSLSLESQVPKGDWHSIVSGWNPNYARPIPQPVSS